MTKSLPIAAFVALVSLTGCATYDKAAGTNTSGVYPAQSDGTRVNPSGTAVTRTFDRAAGTDVSGAYPNQADGTRNNPPGTAVSRTYDKVTGDNTSGAYPQNQRPAPARGY